MLASALGRNRGGGAFHQLEQCLLHAFARHVTRDRRVLGLAADLVDLVDIDDAALRLLDIIVRGLEQFQNDVLDILADIAGFGQRRRIGHGEGHVEGLGERLREQRLAAAGRTDEQDVRLGEFDLARALARMVEALVVIVHRHREHALGAVLADDIIVEHVADFLRRGHSAILLAGETRLGFLADDVVAQLDALVADEHCGSGDELAHFVLRFSAERAIQGALRIGTAQLGHSISFCSGCIMPGT